MKKILITFAVVLLPLTVSAAILNPYVVDEKSPVIAGDSVQIGSYYGLENYTADYVNGYAHFTFTYTHHSCCFDTTPVRTYVTNVDPRSTTTPIVKSTNIIYNLSTINPTDWYLYDVQFDSTGFNTHILEAGTTEIFSEHADVPGLSDTDWVAIANSHPPGSENAVAFTPIPLKSNAQAVHNPIIIIPGIMGSAYKNGQLVIDPILHTYDDLIATLIANGYTEGTDLFTFPYEWRNSNVDTASLLDNKIEQVKAICGCDKVDIVAHSMGGLVARAYIQSLDYDQDVDQLIFLGVPHKGAPTDYTKWEAGKFSPNIGVSDVLTEAFFEAEALRNGYPTVFNYIHNRPVLSVQELLPISDYIKDADSGLIRPYPTNYPRNLFLEDLNDNISTLLTSGVAITNILGNTGLNTVEKIRVIPTDHPIFWEHGEPEGFGALIGDSGLEKGIGDNTVTQASSILSGVTNEEIAASHSRIPTVSENEIVKILTGNNPTTNIDNGYNIDSKILLIQLLSPVDIVVTAPDGKKIGKNFQIGGEYGEIPLAFYSGYQTDEEYITILNPLDGEYKVELIGTGDGEYHMIVGVLADVGSNITTVGSNVETGEKIEYSINIDQGNSTPIVISDPVITPPDSGDPAINLMNQLILNLKNYYDNHQIKDASAYQSLLDLLQSALASLKEAQSAMEKRDEDPSYYDYKIKLAYRAASGKLKTFISTARNYKNQKKITDAAEEYLVDQAKAILDLID